MSLVRTNDNCIGCNKCIKACSSMGANVAAERGRGNVIDVDPVKCIACGACLDVCEHNAREYVDDVDKFFEDLKKGEKISVLIAPAFLANYPNEYEKILGMLKKPILQHGAISNISLRTITTAVFHSPVRQSSDILSVSHRSLFRSSCRYSRP